MNTHLATASNAATEQFWPLSVATCDGTIVSLNAAARALIDASLPAPADAGLHAQVAALCRLVGERGPVETVLMVGGNQLPLCAELLPRESAQPPWVALQFAPAPAHEEVYRRAFHASPDPVIVTRLRDGVVIAANRAVERTSGYPLGELIGRQTSDVNLWVSADDRERLLQAVQEKGRVQEFDAVLRHRSGETRIMAIAAELIEVGGERCMITVAHDVTARRRIEANERESRHRYQALMDNSPSVIFLKSVEGKYLVVNKTFERVLGVRAEDIIGRSDDEIAPPEVAAAYRRDHARLLAAGGPIECADVLVLPSGIRHFFTVKFPLFDESGRIFAIGGIATDFTERYRAETELERKNEMLSVIRQSQSAFISGGEPAEIFSELLAAFLRLTDSRGGAVRECRRGARQMELRTIAERGTQESGDGHRTRLPIFRRGRLIGMVDLLREEAGEPEELAPQVDPLVQTCAVLIEARATEQERAQAVASERQLEAQLRESAKLQAIGTLAGGIAHDFNNILTGIFSGIDLVRMELGTQHPAEVHLALVKRSAQRAKHLVQQILAFSRRAEQKRLPLHVACAVREAAEFLRATLPAPVRLEWSSEDDLSVRADATQLQQVLLNLGTNAAYAMRARGGVLTLRAQRATLDGGEVPLPPGDYVRIEVSDTGEGMDAATIARLFEPFFTTKPAGEGTGLGLAVVHGIVKSHDGAVTVHSERGRGTQFRIFLPLWREIIAAEPAGNDGSGLPRGRGERVCWIDDERVVTTTGESLLRRLGYHVAVFNDADEAWRTLAAAPGNFDLVITDLSMPTMTGLEIVRRLRAARPEARVILMTGYNGALDEAGARAWGVSRLMMKPFPLDQLAREVRDVLDGVRVV